MTTQQAEMTIAAPAADIHRVLTEALALPDWNPAITAITGPTRPEAGVEYAIRVRPGLTGTLKYTTITPDRIDIDWQVPGFSEQSSWTLEPTDASTRAHHEFSHTGPLAAALRSAYRGVAGLRLQRLAERIGR